jgi:hypothetical protein
VRIRRIATAAVTFVVAIVVALALPVSQLRTVETVQERCCCPDPAHCHCPDQKPGSTNEPQLKNCHRVSHDVVAPQLSAFELPQVALVAPPMRIVALVVIAPATPHAAPSPRRPDAPS